MKMPFLESLMVGGLAAALVLTATATAAPKSQNTDAAFSLLIEAFRETQTALVENDYHARLQAAESVENRQTRNCVIALAKQERHLRLRKLVHQMADLSTAYVDSRQSDDETAAAEPATVDTTAAAKQLEGYVVIASGTIEPESETNTAVANEER
jgi:hypothetical protein